MASTAIQWVKERMPKIYLINTNEYPKFEYPRNSGVMHEYPHYVVAGKRVPTGHMAFAGIFGVFVLYKTISTLRSLGSSSSSGKSHHHETVADVHFPAVKRDWEGEKKEFVESYIQTHMKKH
ncbi:hypothetical protein MP228_000856 [Amoeboaphelidium protococcarum]|nr:hypothetical protein MP228_004745 [Amoeboaphelidium protococcarum]KAI3654137.1 hypothetical protein MP228_000856 [Amoeboaphelidium protococcarum]